MPQYLPPEILQEVFTNLENRDDFLSLCRVSRTFKKLAQPLLFRAFTMARCSETCSECCLVPQTKVFGALAQFTRTVLSRTDLQRAVRQIDIRAEDELEPCDDSGALLFDTRMFLLNELQKLRINEGVKLIHARAILSAEIAPILLLLCAKLKRLEIINVTLNESSLIELLEALDTDMGVPLYLSNLTSVNLQIVPGEEYAGGIRLEKIWPFMHLPRLQQFRVDHCIGDYTKIPEGGLSPAAVNASSISLAGCIMDQRSLSTLMNSCKRVESFLYVVAFDLDSAALDAEGLLQALDSQKENLVNLRVELNDMGLELAGDDHIVLGPLTPFTNLKHLYVGQCCLGNTPQLPASLQTLVISHCENPILDLLAHLVEERKDHLRELEMVTVRPSFSPCTLMLGILTEITRAGPYLNEAARFAREEFQEGVRELDAMALEACFELNVDCPAYDEYLRAIMSEEEELLGMLGDYDERIIE